MQTQETKTHEKTGHDKLQTRLDELKTLRDEIRVKIHLAGMDVRDAFRKIEPAVDKAEHEVTHMAKGAGNAVDKAEHEVAHMAKGAAEVVAKTLDSLAASLHKIHARMPK
jgi:hypothetical protein